jgi:hypothetical protein
MSKLLIDFKCSGLQNNKKYFMKNLKSLNKEALKAIQGGGRGVCCDYNDQGKCILWIGPGQFCP